LDAFFHNLKVAYSHSVDSVTTYSSSYLLYGFDANITKFDILRNSGDMLAALTQWLAAL